MFRAFDLLLANIAFWGTIAIPFFFATGFWDGLVKILILWGVCWLVLIIAAAIKASR